MPRKGKIAVAILIVLVAALLLHRFAWIHAPAEGEIICYAPGDEETIRVPLTQEDAVAVKSVLWGHVLWPEEIYGHPACYFDWYYSVTIDGVRYMPAWCCGDMVVADGSDGERRYINVTGRQMEILTEIIKSAAK